MKHVKKNRKGEEDIEPKVTTDKELPKQWSEHKKNDKMYRLKIKNYGIEFIVIRRKKI